MTDHHHRPFRQLAALVGLLALSALAPGCKSDEDKVAGFMERGEAYLEQEKYAEAALEFKNVIQINPNDAKAHELLSTAYFKDRKVRQGYWELSEAVRLSPEDNDLRLTLAALSMAANAHESVIEHADVLIQKTPDDARPYLLKGRALLALDQKDDVEQLFRKAVDLEPEQSLHRVILAGYLRSEDRFDEAEEELREGVRIDPNLTVLAALAQLLALENEDDPEIETLFKRAIEVARKGPQVDDEASGDLDDAARKQIYERHKGGVVAAYTSLAAWYRGQDRPDDAVALLESGIAEADDDKMKVGLIYLLVGHYRGMDDMEAAEATMARATQIDATDPFPYLEISSRRSADGDLPGALEAAEKAVAIDPDRVASRLRVAELKVDLGYRTEDSGLIDEGRKAAMDILVENEDMPEALFVLAKLDLAEQNLGAALEKLAKVIEYRPEWAHGHFVNGSALLLQGDLPEARRELAIAVDLDGNLSEARNMLARVHARLGEHEYALDHGRRYLEQRPADDQIRILVAQSMVALGKVDAAEEELEKIPDDRRDAAALFALGRIKLAKGRLAEGKALLERADRLAPHNARVLGLLYSLAAAEGSSEAMDAKVAEAVAANPDDAVLRGLEGAIALQRKDLKSAEASYRKAIDLDPSDFNYYKHLATILGGTGRADEVVRLYESAVKEAPQRAEAHHLLGVVYESRGRTDDAIRSYGAALDRDPNMHLAKNNLAYLLADSGKDLDRALALAQEAKEALPDSANAADTLGWVLYKRGVAAAAVGYLEEAVRGTPENSPVAGVIRTHLSKAYEANGEKDRAITTLEEAIANLEKRRAEMAEAGREMPDPDWLAPARQDLERLKAS